MPGSRKPGTFIVRALALARRRNQQSRPQSPSTVDSSTLCSSSRATSGLTSGPVNVMPFDLVMSGQRHTDRHNVMRNLDRRPLTGITRPEALPACSAMCTYHQRGAASIDCHDELAHRTRPDRLLIPAEQQVHALSNELREPGSEDDADPRRPRSGSVSPRFTSRLRRARFTRRCRAFMGGGIAPGSSGLSAPGAFILPLVLRAHPGPPSLQCRTGRFGI